MGIANFLKRLKRLRISVIVTAWSKRQSGLNEANPDNIEHDANEVEHLNTNLYCSPKNKQS